MSEWIDVNERMPKSPVNHRSDDVLVTDGKKEAGRIKDGRT